MSHLNRNKGVRDPEIRFSRATRPGEVPEHAPHLGPCLLYVGADNGKGYGQFRYGARNGYAHRYAWERVNGPIPAGLTIDHLCRVRSCVNVEHLELVDGVENTRRAAAVKTHCPSGHEYPTAFQAGGMGKSRCPECRKGQWRRGEAKRKEARAARGNRKIKYDQQVVRDVIGAIRSGRMTIAQGAREIGCHPNYLGRRTWQETKDAVFSRDRGCVVCGAESDLDAHHRIARGMGGASNPKVAFGLANLVALCRSHHNEVEANPSWARARGLRVDRGTEPSGIHVSYHGRVVQLTDEGDVITVFSEEVPF